MNNNNFCSFDDKGNAIIWKDNYRNNANIETIIFKKEWQFNSDGEYSINYSNTIYYLDNFYFVLGSNNNLYQCEPQYSGNKSTFLCKSKYESKISSLLNFGTDSLD